jgi:16S rRNA (cytosine1402-N4)-methyltransferase
VGLGGHSAELLKRVMPGGKVIGIDFDGGNLERAREKLARVGGDFELVQNNFAALPTVLAELGIEKVDGVLADVGVASPQIDDPGRGFSYRGNGPLDMRMDQSRGKTGAEWLARMSEREIARALLELGDEDDAEEIARLIVERREEKAIATTQDLVAIVCEARDFTLKRAAGAKLHPAARTFQALRILVNRELANLERLLAVLPEVLKPGGVAAVISFHSGEDRRVKGAFAEGFSSGVYEEISREAVVASEEEIRGNARARSAKLRWARRKLEMRNTRQIVNEIRSTKFEIRDKF